MLKRPQRLAMLIVLGLVISFSPSHAVGQFVVELDFPKESHVDILCYGSSDDKYFVADGRGFWEFDNAGKLIGKTPLEIQSAIFIPQKKAFIARANEHLIEFSHVQQSTAKLPISGDFEPLSVSENGEFLLAQEYDKKIQIFETKSWTPLLKNELILDDFDVVSLSADGSLLAIGYRTQRENDLVEIIDISTGEVIAKSSGLVKHVESVQFLQGGDKVAIVGSAGGKHGVSVFDTKTLRQRKFLFPAGGTLFGLEHEGLLGLMGGDTIMVFDAYSGETIMHAESSDADDIRFENTYVVPNTSKIVSGSLRAVVLEHASSRNVLSPVKAIRAFPILSSKMDTTERLRGANSIEIAWHPAGKTIAVATPLEGKPSGGGGITPAGSVMNSTRDAIVDGTGVFRKQSSKAHSAQFPTIRFINCETRKQVSSYSLQKRGAFYELKFSPSGKQLACRKDKYELLLFDLQAKKTRTLSFEKSKPYCRDFSFEFGKDEESILALSSGELQRRSLLTGTGEIISKMSGVYSLDLLGKSRALCGTNIVNLTTGEVDASFGGRSDLICRAANEPFAVSSHGEIRDLDRWNLETLEREGFFAGEFRDFAVSDDGALVAAAYANKTIRVWDVGSMRQIGVLRGHEGPIDALAFHPTKPMLASVSRTGDLLFWTIENTTKAQTGSAPPTNHPSHFRFKLGDGGSVEAHFPGSKSKAELIADLEELLGELKSNVNEHK